jgi:hypothetical protein
MHPDSLGGEYFVTLCTRHRALLLDSPRVRSIIRRVWQGLPGRFPGHVELDAFVIMPNHIHGILVLVSPEAVALEGSEGGESTGCRGDGAGAMNGAPTRTGAMNRAPSAPASVLVRGVEVPSRHTLSGLKPTVTASPRGGVGSNRR